MITMMLMMQHDERQQSTTIQQQSRSNHPQIVAVGFSQQSATITTSSNQSTSIHQTLFLHQSTSNLTNRMNESHQQSHSAASVVAGHHIVQHHIQRCNNRPTSTTIKQQQAQHQQQQQQQNKNLKQCVATPFYRRLFNYIREAWTGVRSALDTDLEDLGEPTPRYRPDSLEALRRATRFTDGEIKAIYRGFKAECPTGIFREETFKVIYSQFFPQGANTNNYAHYLFNTLNPDNSGCVSFDEFVHVLSILSRGTLDEKLRWAFSLYDINGDGFITKDEMTEIVTAIYDLMGDISQPSMEDQTVKQRVDSIFQKMDLNRDGLVTLEEFLECCKNDEGISSSLNVFDTSI